MEAVVNYQNFTNFRRKRMKLLKGNFQPKKNPELKDTEKDQSSFDENFKKKSYRKYWWFDGFRRAP